ncbi:acyltransferase [Arthrobacter sp. D3-18]
MQRKYFGELDGVRAISVLLVFTVHLSYPFWHSLHGGAGVTIFFVLSGYLITTLALREEAKNGRLNLKSFYVRRLFRIYPIYFAVLAAYVVLILGLGMQSNRKSAFLETLPFYVLFFPERPMLMRGDAVSVPFAGAWSLGIEEKFYLVWPLLGFVILAWKFRARLLALSIMVAGFAATAILGATGAILQPYALIALGCISAVMLNNKIWYDRIKFLGKGWVLAITGGILLVMQFGTREILPERSLYVAYGLVATLVLTGIVITTTKGIRWLAAKPMVFLGKISYVFYLTHNFGINGAEMVVPKGGPFWAVVTAIVGLVASIAIAWALHIAIEKPMIKVGHRVAHRYKALKGVPSVVEAEAPRIGAPRHLAVRD